MNARKYIIIPEFKPLHAMRKCFGPEHGPLNSPTPTPIDVIGELIVQHDTLTVLEVVPTGKNKFSDPVKLTSENYKLPYDVILGTSSTPTVPAPEIVEEEPHIVVDPIPAHVSTGTGEVEASHEDTSADAEVKSEDVAVENDVEVESSEQTDGADDTQIDETLEEDAQSEEASRPMTRAERKAAQRAAANK